jgi:peptidoglycan L-alanyl-D-glutamate endopeptidase CwlK
MDEVSEQRLSLVYPVLASKIRSMAEALQSKGVVIRVVQGLRTVDEQNALYAQGRTVPKTTCVTNCRGGHSYHNFGLAVDCVPSSSGPDQPYNPDWNSSHPVWKQMEAAGKAQGLAVGALWRTFPDAPHFQLTGPYPEGCPSAACQDLLAKGGMPAVWGSVTAYLAEAGNLSKQEV